MANIAITGAARGIAFELARMHLKAGDRVYALARNPAGSGPLNELAAGSGGRLTVHAMDVGSDASVTACAADTGSDSIDVLYNVAGVIGTVPPELADVNWDVWDDTFNINVKGPLRVLNAFLPRLQAGSKVINVSSQIAASTWPYGGYHAYAASKAALGRMMRSIATDLKERGIIIGIVHPGYVQTDMGGPTADITPHESASGLLKVAAEWTLDQSGDFKKWNGDMHPW
jgi:NAD(P)-dependent dehydrogenase (short-subunit alcohol dehydrogenase family)